MPSAIKPWQRSASWLVNLSAASVAFSSEESWWKYSALLKASNSHREQSLFSLSPREVLLEEHRLLPKCRDRCRSDVLARLKLRESKLPDSGCSSLLCSVSSRGGQGGRSEPLRPSSRSPEEPACSGTSVQLHVT